MKFAGLMRVKNEERHIEESIESLLPLCERVFVLDDHSTDNTIEVCRSFRDRVTVCPSPFSDLNESRDKTWLLAHAMESHPEWVMFLDGDEVLESRGPDKILRHIKTGSGIRVLSFTVPYYWNDTEHVRIDGSFGKLVRGSAFRVSDLSANDRAFYNYNYAKGGLHCGCIPMSLNSVNLNPLNVALWHYGYMDAETRKRKFEFYNSVDSGNPNEDSYRHIIQGDEGGPNTTELLKYAGPLTLATTQEVREAHGFSKRPREL